MPDEREYDKSIEEYEMRRDLFEKIRNLNKRESIVLSEEEKKILLTLLGFTPL